MLKHGILQKLRQVFGVAKITPPKEMIMPNIELPYMDGVLGWYNKTMQMSRDRRSIYYDMEQIGDFVLGSSALEMYTEDAFPFNQDRGATIWISSGNQKIIQVLDELNRRVEIETLIPAITYTTAQYGDDFQYLLLSEKGIESIRQIPPYMLTRIEDHYGRLLGYTPGIVDYVPGRDSNIPTPLSRPWDILHTRLFSSYTRVTGHGTSMLMPVRYIWRQLKIMMDAMVLYRWTRGPDRMVYYIDVGTAPPEQQMRILNQWKLYIKKRQHFNPESHSFDQEWNPECYTADTKVPLLDGRTLTMLDLCQEYPKGTFFGVYSIDPKTHRVVPGLASHPHLVQKKTPILKITLDNGSVLRCTYKNGIMLRSGKMVYAQDLKPGDALMPLNRRINQRKNMGGYEQVYCPNTGEWEFTHRLMKQYDGPDHAIHHKNFNKRDNRPENLVSVSIKKHKRMHGPVMAAYNKSAAHRQKARETNYRLREQKAQHLRDYNRSQKRLDDFRAFWADDKRSATSRAKRSKCLQSTWQNPEKRESIIASLRESGKRRSRTEAGKQQASQNMAHAWYAKCDICDIFMIRNKDVYPNKKAGVVCSCGNRYDWIYIQGRKAWELNQLLKSVGTQVPIPKIDSSFYMNHTVVSVEPDGHEDVYDFTVKDYHNFAISDCDIMVSNSIDEDIFWPTSKNSQSKIERLAGASNVSDIADVQLYVNLFFAGLRIPKAFMGFEGEIMAREVLPYQSIRYANVAYKLQRSVLASLVRMYQIHLAVQGFDVRDPDNSFKVHTSTISHLYDVAKSELLQAKMEIMRSLLEFGDNVQLNRENWLQYILRTYLDMDNGVIQSLMPDDSQEQMPSNGARQAIDQAVQNSPEAMEKLKTLHKMAPFFNPFADSRNNGDDYDTVAKAMQGNNDDQFQERIRELIEKRNSEDQHGNHRKHRS